MELFGIGTAELIAILLIMLVVAGPKRMIRWAYILGQQVARLRGMWAETMAVVQKEFDQAGMDIRLPKDLPTRAGLASQIQATLRGAARPVTNVLDEVKADVSETSAALTGAQKVES